MDANISNQATKTNEEGLDSSTVDGRSQTNLDMETAGLLSRNDTTHGNNEQAKDKESVDTSLTLNLPEADEEQEVNDLNEYLRNSGVVIKEESLEVEEDSLDSNYVSDSLRYKQGGDANDEVLNNSSIKSEPDSDSSHSSNFSSDAKKTKYLTKKKSRSVYRCKYCGQQLHRVSSLQKHEEGHRNGTIYKCRFCEYYALQRDRIATHECKHTGEKPFSCGICEFKCASRGDLSRHRQRHFPDRPYQCELCPLNFKLASGLRHHMVSHSEERRFSCTICNAKFKTKCALDNHVKLHSDVMNYFCSQCDYACKTPNLLRLHIKTHSDIRNFPCTHPGCSQRCKTRSDLVKHMSVHKTGLDFKCVLCGKQFKSRHSLLSHTRRHEKREYPCSVCHKVLHSHNSLRLHMLNLHLVGKKIECQICGHMFATNINLRCHMKVHNADRSFRCPLCLHGFKSVNHLFTHIGSMHGKDYVYYCDICKRPFSRFMMMKFHIDRHHRDSKDISNHEEFIYNKECSSYDTDKFDRKLNDLLHVPNGDSSGGSKEEKTALCYLDMDCEDTKPDLEMSLCVNEHQDVYGGDIIGNSADVPLSQSVDSIVEASLSVGDYNIVSNTNGDVDLSKITQDSERVSTNEVSNECHTVNSVHSHNSDDIVKSASHSSTSDVIEYESNTKSGAVNEFILSNDAGSSNDCQQVNISKESLEAPISTDASQVSRTDDLSSGQSSHEMEKDQIDLCHTNNPSSQDSNNVGSMDSSKSVLTDEINIKSVLRIEDLYTDPTLRNNDAVSSKSFELENATQDSEMVQTDATQMCNTNNPTASQIPHDSHNDTDNSSYNLKNGTHSNIDLCNKILTIKLERLDESILLSAKSSAEKQPEKFQYRRDKIIRLGSYANININLAGKDSGVKFNMKKGKKSTGWHTHPDNMLPEAKEKTINFLLKQASLTQKKRGVKRKKRNYNKNINTLENHLDSLSFDSSQKGKGKRKKNVLVSAFKKSKLPRKKRSLVDKNGLASSLNSNAFHGNSAMDIKTEVGYNLYHMTQHNHFSLQQMSTSESRGEVREQSNQPSGHNLEMEALIRMDQQSLSKGVVKKMTLKGSKKSVTSADKKSTNLKKPRKSLESSKSKFRTGIRITLSKGKKSRQVQLLDSTVEDNPCKLNDKTLESLEQQRDQELTNQEPSAVLEVEKFIDCPLEVTWKKVGGDKNSISYKRLIGQYPQSSMCVENGNGVDVKKDGPGAVLLSSENPEFVSLSCKDEFHSGDNILKNHGLSIDNKESNTNLHHAQIDNSTVDHTMCENSEPSTHEFFSVTKTNTTVGSVTKPCSVKVVSLEEFEDEYKKKPKVVANVSFNSIQTTPGPHHIQSNAVKKRKRPDSNSPAKRTYKKKMKIMNVDDIMNKTSPEEEEKTNNQSIQAPKRTYKKKQKKTMNTDNIMNTTSPEEEEKTNNQSIQAPKRTYKKKQKKTMNTDNIMNKTSPKEEEKTSKQSIQAPKRTYKKKQMKNVNSDDSIDKTAPKEDLGSNDWYFQIQKVRENMSNGQSKTLGICDDWPSVEEDVDCSESFSLDDVSSQTNNSNTSLKEFMKDLKSNPEKFTKKPATKSKRPYIRKNPKQTTGKAGQESFVNGMFLSGKMRNVEGGEVGVVNSSSDVNASEFGLLSHGCSPKLEIPSSEIVTGDSETQIQQFSKKAKLTSTNKSPKNLSSKSGEKNRKQDGKRKIKEVTKLSPKNKVAIRNKLKVSALFGKKMDRKHSFQSNVEQCSDGNLEAGNSHFSSPFQMKKGKKEPKLSNLNKNSTHQKVKKKCTGRQNKINSSLQKTKANGKPGVKKLNFQKNGNVRKDRDVSAITNRIKLPGLTSSDVIERRLTVECVTLSPKVVLRKCAFNILHPHNSPLVFLKNNPQSCNYNVIHNGKSYFNSQSHEKRENVDSLVKMETNNGQIQLKREENQGMSLSLALYNNCVHGSGKEVILQSNSNSNLNQCCEDLKEENSTRQTTLLPTFVNLNNSSEAISDTSVMNEDYTFDVGSNTPATSDIINSTPDAISSQDAMILTFSSTTTSTPIDNNVSSYAITGDVSLCTPSLNSSEEIICTEEITDSNDGDLTVVVELRDKDNQDVKEEILCS